MVTLRKHPGAAFSIKMCTSLHGCGSTALLSPLSQSRLCNIYCESPRVASPLSCHTLPIPAPPRLYAISDGHESDRQSPNGGCAAGFCQPAAAGQGTHVLSAEVLSKPRGRSNRHGAQKLLKGSVEEGGGQRREEKLPILLITFLLCSSYTQLGKFIKSF